MAYVCSHVHSASGHVMRSRTIPMHHGYVLSADKFSCAVQNLRSLSADVRQLPGFAGSTGQAGALTARDLLFPDSYADAYQLDMDTSQGPTLNAAYLSVSFFMRAVPAISSLLLAPWDVC